VDDGAPSGLELPRLLAPDVPSNRYSVVGLSTIHWNLHWSKTSGNPIFRRYLVSVDIG